MLMDQESNLPASSDSNKNSSAIVTRCACSDDLKAIVRVHVKSFPGFFLSHLGPGFLYQYYRLVLEFDKAIVVIAESDGIVVGFVSGFVDPKAFFSLMRRSKLRFVIPVLAAILRNPAIISRLVANVKKVSGNGLTEEHPNQLAELASVAVDPNWSGRGIGQMLVQAFLSTASNAGADSVYLTTDADKNDRVNRFYLELGFVIAEKFDSAGRLMNKYTVELNATTERSLDG